MIIISWNVRDVGQVGFTHKIVELASLYHPDIIFFMETRVNSNRANNIINRLSRIFLFHFKVLSTGYATGLWVL